jgi:hypothetical protein
LIILFSKEVYLFSPFLIYKNTTKSSKTEYKKQV